MRIISFRNREDIDVEFLDENRHVKRNTIYANFIKGQIKNPYDKTMFGIGMLGVGAFKTRENDKLMTREYKTWNNMLIRCYDKKEKEKHESYYDICTVCDEWFNFQNFARWYIDNFYEVGTERMHLDKDILIPGNKLYSPENCLIVPQRINMLFVNRPNNRGLPNGIIKTANGYEAKYNGKSVGKYCTVHEAFEKYAIQKKDAICRVAEEYRKFIPEKLYMALLAHDVLLENDRNYKAS